MHNSPFYAYAIDRRNNGYDRWLLTFINRSVADEWWRAVSQNNTFQRITPQFYLYDRSEEDIFYLLSSNEDLANFAHRMMIQKINNLTDPGITMLPPANITDHISGNWYHVRSTLHPDMYWSHNGPTINLSRDLQNRATFCVKALEHPDGTVIIGSDLILISVALDVHLGMDEGGMLITSRHPHIFMFKDLEEGKFLISPPSLALKYKADAPKQDCTWELVPSSSIPYTIAKDNSILHSSYNEIVSHNIENVVEHKPYPVGIVTAFDTGKLASFGLNCAIHAVALSPDGRRVVSGSEDNAIRIWDSATRQRTKWDKQYSPVRFVAVSPDGKFIASGSFNGYICIWDMEKGENVKSFQTHDTSGQYWRGRSQVLFALVFSRDGRRILAGTCHATVQILDIEGNMTKVISYGAAYVTPPIAVSPDERFAAAQSQDSTIRIWDIENSAVLGEPLRGHTKAITSVVFSPDSNHIVSSSEEVIRIWEVTTGKLIRELRLHAGYVTSVAVSPDGKLVAAASSDKDVHVWDMEKGVSVGEPLKGHTDRINSIVFSPDGDYLVSGSNDFTIRRWKLSAVGIDTSQAH